ncbi:MAG: hypothetical protein ACI4PE_03445 [Bacilli bacterium]
MKNNIIYCDFRRTERRKELQRIEQIFSEIIQKFQDTNFNDEMELISDEEFYKLQQIYGNLINEEKEWGGCKYWK